MRALLSWFEANWDKAGILFANVFHLTGEQREYTGLQIEVSRIMDVEPVQIS